jgi:hypothetical protein
MARTTTLDRFRILPAYGPAYGKWRVVRIEGMPPTTDADGCPLCPRCAAELERVLTVGHPLHPTYSVDASPGPYCIHCKVRLQTDEESRITELGVFLRREDAVSYVSSEGLSCVDREDEPNGRPQRDGVVGAHGGPVGTRSRITRAGWTGIVMGVSLLGLAVWWNQPVTQVPASGRTVVSPRQGDRAMRGGTATVRRPFVQPPDDPRTSNDESNDQPVGYLGTRTLSVCSRESGSCYILDAELDGSELSRVYFPKGGWVDFEDCELDADFHGECEDEKGRPWSFEGEQ